MGYFYRKQILCRDDHERSGIFGLENTGSFKAQLEIRRAKKRMIKIMMIQSGNSLTILKFLLLIHNLPFELHMMCPALQKEKGRLVDSRRFKNRFHFD